MRLSLLFFSFLSLILVLCQNQWSQVGSSYQPNDQWKFSSSSGGGSRGSSNPEPIIKSFGQTHLEVEQRIKGAPFQYPSVPFYVENSQDFTGSLTFKWELRGSIDTPGEYPIYYTLYHNGVEIKKAPQLTLKVMNVDECQRGIHECPPEAKCIDTNGSYECRCGPGFKNVMENPALNRGCQDIDECSIPEYVSQCSEHSICINERGSFHCVCKTGYTGDGRVCIDKNECLNPNDNDCHKEGAECINHPYREDLRAGYTCRCKEEEGWVGDGKMCYPKTTCPDNHNCPPNSFCKPNLSLPQRFECLCKDGYRGNPGLGIPCVDIDECSEHSHSCKHPLTCLNTPGSYNCHCKKDWVPDGAGGCVNVACSKQQCGKGQECIPVYDDPSRSFECRCDKYHKFSPSGLCVPSLSILENLPPTHIKQCQSITLSVPSVTVADDVQVYLSAPPELYSLYVREMTPPDRPHLIRINVTDNYGRDGPEFITPVHVINLDECNVPPDHWTDQAILLKNSSSEYFHIDCKPQCHLLCDESSPNCAVCVDTPGSYKCECGRGFRMERIGQMNRCIDNVPPEIFLRGESSLFVDLCFDCSQFFRKDDIPIEVADLSGFNDPGCYVKDNIDPISEKCQTTYNRLGPDIKQDGLIIRKFEIIYNSQDSAGNQAKPVHRKVTLRIADLRSAVEELKTLSKLNNSFGKVMEEHELLTKNAYVILAILLGILLAIFVMFSRRAVNMVAYLLGAGMSYPAFEEGGTLWLMITRWWWTDNERRQFLLTQWALKRE